MTDYDEHYDIIKATKHNDLINELHTRYPIEHDITEKHIGMCIKRIRVAGCGRDVDYSYLGEEFIVMGFEIRMVGRRGPYRIMNIKSIEPDINGNISTYPTQYQCGWIILDKPNINV